MSDDNIEDYVAVELTSGAEVGGCCFVIPPLIVFWGIFFYVLYCTWHNNQH